MKKVIIFFIFFFFNNVGAIEQLKTLDKKLICKKYNSKDKMIFKFLASNLVELKKYIDSNEIINKKLKYFVSGEKIIIYNPEVLPIRQETHINLENLEMKTGLFTNRYPLISRGRCKGIK